jgi:phage major head subunit gpT-like protein
MIVSSDTLAAIRTDFQAIFLEAYAGFVARWQEIATEFPSTGEFLDLSWLGAHPAMKEWVDQKVYEGLRRHRYAITNKDWEATLEVMRKAIEDDSLGLYKPRIQEMAIEGKRHPDELVSALLTGGTSGLAFDGLAFFADTRAIGDSGNIDNLLGGTGTSQAQFAADFVAARAALYSFLNDRGKPANPVLDLITVVPPALQYVAEQTFNASMILASDNILKGAARVWPNPYLTATDANDFYVLNVFGPIKPLALSMRKVPGFYALDSMSSDHVFKKGSYLYSVEARYNGGYLLPWKAVKTVNT